MKDKSRVFINSGIVFASTIIEYLIFFAINLIIARFLSVEHFGEYITALGYATFFSTITNIGINQTLIRLVNIDPGKEKEHFTSAFVIKCILGVIIYLIMAISLWFTNYSHQLIYLTLIMGVFRIGSEFISAFYSLFDAKETFIVSSIVRIIFSALFLILTLGVVMFNGDLFDFAYVRLWLVVLFLFILGITSRKYITKNITKQSLLNFTKESITFGIFNVLVNAFHRTNIIFLSLIHGSIYTGVFSNGFIFFTTLFFVPINLSRVLLPYLYKTPFEKDKNKFQFAFDIYTKYLTMLAFYFLMGGLLFSKDVIYLVFTNKYHDSIPVLQIITIGIPFVFTIAPTLITSLDKQPVLTKIHVYGFIVNIVSNGILIYLFKSVGAALAAVLTYLFVYIASHYYLAVNNYINISATVKNLLYQILILSLCFLVKLSLPHNIHWFYLMAAVSMVWLTFNLLFVFNSNDLRILKEIIRVDK